MQENLFKEKQYCSSDEKVKFVQTIFENGVLPSDVYCEYDENYKIQNFYRLIDLPDEKCKLELKKLEVENLSQIKSILNYFKYLSIALFILLVIGLGFLIDYMVNMGDVFSNLI